METLAELLEEQIKDLYSAENQLAKALPKMAKAASTPELKEAFETHLEETRTHAERLEQVAEELEIKPKGKTCAAMKGLIEEGKEALEEGEKGPVLDAALIAAAQRVEHYEIAAYGTVRELARQLGHENVAKIFEETLEEESETDKKLTDIAETNVYPGAIESMSEDSEEFEEEEAPRSRSRGGRNAR